MTVKFLAKHPGVSPSSEMLSEMLRADAGRLYLLTGNVSVDKNVNSEFAEILRWAAFSPKREIVVLVGIWRNYPEKVGIADNYHIVVEQVARLVVGAITSLLRENSSVGYTVNITFRAAFRWHVKALGLTGSGKKFREATHAIFGSTNFSEHARHGDNYELDIYLNRITTLGANLLKEYATSVGGLIKKAMKETPYIDFDADVRKRILYLLPKVSLSSAAII